MKYVDQYESSYDQWPRTVVGWVGWIVFMLPGTVILWFEYMFPSRGQAWGSGRRAQNRVVTVLTTLCFYALSVTWVAYLIASRPRM